MITLNWHELFRAEDPSSLRRTGLGTPGKARFAVSDRAFARQLEALQQTGLRIATAEQRPDVCVTFDDGGISNRELAWPLLHQHGVRAHFFVCPGLLGSPGFLSPAHLRELAAAGNSIGSHGHLHRSLVELSDEELGAELRDSKQALEALLGQPCTAFALPGGQGDARVMAAIWAAGYQTVFTSAPLEGGSERVIGRYAIRATTRVSHLRGLVTHQRAATGYENARHAGLAFVRRLWARCGLGSSP